MGFEVSRQATAPVTASFISNVFMFRSLEKYYSCPGNAIYTCVLGYGIGGLAAGGALQINDAQDGRGGVGIRLPLPCLEGEQLGSVRGLQVMHVPVKTSMLG